MPRRWSKSSPAPNSRRDVSELKLTILMARTETQARADALPRFTNGLPPDRAGEVYSDRPDTQIARRWRRPRPHEHPLAHRHLRQYAGRGFDFPQSSSQRCTTQVARYQLQFIGRFAQGPQDVGCAVITNIADPMPKSSPALR